MSVEATDAPSRIRWATAAVVGVAVVAGFAFRWWILARGLSPTESDEAVLGLIAIRALRGQGALMYWGQWYGGPVEAYVCAFAFLITGPSVVVSKMVGCALAGVASICTWRAGRRLIGPTAGAVAGVLLWTAAPFFVWYSAKLSIYFGSLALATGVLLCVAQLHDRAPVTRRRWWAPVFGLVTGMAFWASPQVLFLLVPVGLVFAASMIKQWRIMAVAVPFAVVGALPWIVFNIRNDWASLTVPPSDVEFPYSERLRGFFPMMPMLLGLRHVGTETWVGPAWIGVGVCIAIGVFAIGGVVSRRPWWRVALVALLVPVVYAASPLSVRLFGGQPRYLLLAMPALVLVAGRLVAGSGGARRLPAIALVVAAVVGLTYTGLWDYERRWYGRFPGSPDGVAVPDDFRPLLDLLEEEEISHAYADYWISFRATFETGEQTIIAPVQAHLDRFPPYSREVAAADRPAYIMLGASRVPGRLEARLAELAVPYEVFARAEFVVIIPDRTVVRDEVAGAFY